MYIYDKAHHTNNTLDDFWDIEISQRLIHGKLTNKISFLFEFFIVKACRYSKFIRHTPFLELKSISLTQLIFQPFNSSFYFPVNCNVYQRC